MFKEACVLSRIFHVGKLFVIISSESQVRVTRGDLALDVVTLAEESKPVVKHFLVFWFEIFPLRSAFLLLQRRLCESSGCVLTGKDCVNQSANGLLRCYFETIPEYEAPGSYALLPVTSKTVPYHMLGLTMHLALSSTYFDGHICWITLVCSFDQCVSKRLNKEGHGLINDIPSHFDR